MDGDQVFADTSGFLALMDKDDSHHATALGDWKTMAQNRCVLWTSDYVRLESCSLIQRRLGAAALREFHDHILPVTTIIPVGEDGFERAFAQWRVAQLRHLSLVDLTSFDCMHRGKIPRAFTFDQHFQEQGFAISAR
ncbi:MAG: PIN domain-containing protein [Verrucomicrobia bacterium]|nr:PIN domain-containing protein [Verrucomicrobiota bacterium]MDA1204256.1 PIN domain-containing protein [Verrucomicrobiota bacterium]